MQLIWKIVMSSITHLSLYFVGASVTLGSNSRMPAVVKVQDNVDTLLSKLYRTLWFLPSRASKTIATDYKSMTVFFIPTASSASPSLDTRLLRPDLGPHQGGQYDCSLAVKWPSQLNYQSILKKWQRQSSHVMIKRSWTLIPPGDGLLFISLSLFLLNVSFNRFLEGVLHC